MGHVMQYLHIRDYVHLVLCNREIRHQLGSRTGIWPGSRHFWLRYDRKREWQALFNQWLVSSREHMRANANRLEVIFGIACVGVDYAFLDLELSTLRDVLHPKMIQLSNSNCADGESATRSSGSSSAGASNNTSNSHDNDNAETGNATNCVNDNNSTDGSTSSFLYTSRVLAWQQTAKESVMTHLREASQTRPIANRVAQAMLSNIRAATGGIAILVVLVVFSSFWSICSSSSFSSDAAAAVSSFSLYCLRAKLVAQWLLLLGVLLATIWCMLQLLLTYHCTSTKINMYRALAVTALMSKSSAVNWLVSLVDRYELNMGPLYYGPPFTHTKLLDWVHLYHKRHNNNNDDYVYTYSPIGVVQYAHEIFRFTSLAVIIASCVLRARDAHCVSSFAQQ